jgi:hypothetical protein
LPWSSAQPTRGTSSHTFRWIFCGAGGFSNTIEIPGMGLWNC